MNKTFVLLAGMLFYSPTVIGETSKIPYYMYNAASEFNLDVALLYAICTVESNCKPRAINHDDGTRKQKSEGIKDKSYGMFQIKLTTAQRLGFKATEVVMVEKLYKGKVKLVPKVINYTADLLKPTVNTWYAAKLLRHLYDRYGNTEKVISAYNAGRYTKANTKYVNKVLRHYARYKLDKRF